ncbi:MAG: hypothetical protein ACT4P5_22825 [Armatimonadota bacterium]
MKRPCPSRGDSAARRKRVSTQALTGWARHGGRVLDVVAEEGVDLNRVILG